MPEIELELGRIESPNKIVLGSANEKFPFSLTADIEDNLILQVMFNYYSMGNLILW